MDTRNMEPINDQSVFLSCGVIHESVFRKVAGMTYPKARKWLKSLWFTHGEQDEVIRKAKEFYEGEPWFRLHETKSDPWYKSLDNYNSSSQT